MSLSHSVQIEHKQQDDLFNPIYQFLDNIGNIQQLYGSFEQAEKAIKQLVGELEVSMVQETLSQYDINVPIIEYDLCRSAKSTYFCSYKTTSNECLGA